MSQPAFAALAPLPRDFELVVDDGEPLESEWHRIQINKLVELLQQARAEQGRTDVYVNGNAFVYYSVEQARQVAEEIERRGKVEVRGPDVFWVEGVPDANRMRDAWVTWEEGGRLPDVIFELYSKSNRLKHRKQKKELYSKVFRTAEYFYVQGPRGRGLEGFRLAGGEYRPIAPDARGWLWSERINAFVGPWHGAVFEREGDWIRLYRPDGTLVPLAEERADAERERAEAAEAELARLRALLAGRALEE